MKKFVVLLTSIMFSVSVFADTGSTNGAGSGAGGPFVECKLNDGRVDFTPVMNCQHKGGEVIR